MSSTVNTDPFLTTEEAGTYLGISPRTLEGHRRFETGPVFVRLSYKPVRYRRSTLDTWAAGRL